MWETLVVGEVEPRRRGGVSLLDAALVAGGAVVVVVVGLALVRAVVGLAATAFKVLLAVIVIAVIARLVLRRR
jgi:hypothetical protein